MIPTRSVWSVPLVLALGTGTFGADLPRRVTIRGNGNDLGETPLAVKLGKDVAPNIYILEREADGRKFPAEIIARRDQILFLTVLDRVQATGEDHYAIRIRTTEDAPLPGVTLADDGPNLQVMLGGELFTRMVADPNTKPYLFPVIGPTGRPITRAYPMKMVEGEDRDHPHQRSFWFTHGKVNGVDFWSEARGHGTIRERNRDSWFADRGGSAAWVETDNDWLGPDGKKVCQDQRRYRFYHTKNIRVIDFDITIMATEGPVTFGDTKEGMFGLRVASSMDAKKKAGGKIVNGEGLTDGDAWGKASPWVDYTGPVDGKTVGVAILNHPSSFRYPTTWHVRDYGLFAANPFGWHDFGMKQAGDHTIAKGDSITFGYRILFHEGDTTTARLPAAFKAYAQPPTVEVR